MGKHKRRDKHAENRPAPQAKPPPPESPAMSWSGLGSRVADRNRLFRCGHEPA